MYLLSLDNIDHIKSDISRQRVSYFHLLDELVDHVCCDVEKEMNEGLTFENAYSKVKTSAGSNRFKKIQEETLFLIDKNYRTMKTFMKIFGVLSPTLLALAALFKIQHWPGASIMLVLGVFFLSFFFLPSSTYVLYIENKSSKKHLLMYLSGLFSSSIILIGILFKVMHWPGAGIAISFGMVLAALVFLPSLVFSKISDDKGEGKKTAYLVGLFAGLFYIAGFLFKLMHWPGAAICIIIGLILTVAVFLPAYTYAHFKDEIHVKGRFIFFTFTVMMAVLTISLISLSVSRNIFNEFVATGTQMDNVHDDLILNNNGLAKKLISENSINETVGVIHDKTIEIENWIDALKRELIITTDPDSEALTGDKINYKDIHEKDNISVPFEILIGKENDGKAFQLKDMLQSYRELLLSYSDGSKIISSLNILLNVSQETEIYDYTYGWVELQFKHRTLITVLNSLTTIQIQLRLAEKEIITVITRNESETGQKIIAADNSNK